nr:histidine phosphatase family protein [Sporosarcina sp. ACRSL]
MIRHGETDWNALGKLQGRTDIPLNETGMLQAEECREFLNTSHWNVVITSPLKRAKQTAEIINGNRTVPVVEMEEFLERGYGDAEGMTFEERISKFPDKQYPNQEDRASLNQRVMEGIEKINQMYGDHQILLVAHGAVINAILAVLSNGEIGSGKTKLLNACMSNIYFHQGTWRVKDFNQTSHLSK